MEETMGLIAVFFLCALPIYIVWARYKYVSHERELLNKERMALIEKGISDFPMEQAKKIKQGIYIHRYLFTGVILTGLGVALLFAGMVIYLMKGRVQEETIVFGSIFLFPGIGILFFCKNLYKKEREEKQNSGQLIE